MEGDRRGDGDSYVEDGYDIKVRFLGNLLTRSEEATAVKSPSSTLGDLLCIETHINS